MNSATTIPADIMTALKKDLDAAKTLFQVAYSADDRAHATAIYKGVCDVCHTLGILLADVEAFVMPSDPPHFVSHEDGHRLSFAVRVF
jgi:hypothetical protein